MNDCASAGENQIRGCSLSRAIGAITPQHSQHLIIFVKKSVAIPFLDLLLDNSLNFNVELFYPEGRIEKNGPLSKVLFKNYQVIIDGYRLQTLTIKKLKDKLK